MANTTSIARPYAKAAFEVAKAANQLQMWSLALKQLSLVALDSEIKSILKNPGYTKKQLSDLFISCLHKMSGNGSTSDFLPVENFIKLLAEKKRLNLLSEISALFAADCAKESGYLSLTVTSAFAMDDAQKNNTKEKLAAQLKSKVEIDFYVDEKLIGGLLVRSGNWVLDGTIKGNLERLKSALI